MHPQLQNDGSYTLIGHLSELKKRLIYSGLFFLVSFICCYIIAEEIYAFLLRPLSAVYDSPARKMIYTNLTEAFFTYMKLALFAGFFVAFPFIASQIYIFVAPGLYKNEKKILLPYLIACPVLFLCGAVLVYYLIFPAAWKFFLSFQTNGLDGGLPILLEARVSEYLSLVTHLILAFGIAFQLPVLLTLLVRCGFLKTTSLIKKRRVAIVVIFVIAAIITPPDVISQIGLAIPMIILYELTIFTCKYLEKE